MKKFNNIKNELLKDKEVQRAYDALKPEFELLSAIIKKRMKKGLTQAELARKIGTRQSAISRLESGAYNPSLSFLQKIANAMDARLKISLAEK